MKHFCFSLVKNFVCILSSLWFELNLWNDGTTFILRRIKYDKLKKNRNAYSSVWMELFKIANKVRKAKHDNNNQMFIFEIWKKAKVENSHSWKYFSTEEYSEHIPRKTRTFNGHIFVLIERKSWENKYSILFV